MIAASVILSLVFPRKSHDKIAAAPVEEQAHDAGQMDRVSTTANRRGLAKKEKPQESRPRMSKSTIRFLWKTVGFYLLLLGLGLIMAAALTD